MKLPENSLRVGPVNGLRLHPPVKFNSEFSLEKWPFDPIGKAFLPRKPFFRGELLNFGGVTTKVGKDLSCYCSKLGKDDSCVFFSQTSQTGPARFVIYICCILRLWMLVRLPFMEYFKPINYARSTGRDRKESLQCCNPYHQSDLVVLWNDMKWCEMYSMYRMKCRMTGWPESDFFRASRS